jgi:predicted enzyme involved in methoxymalonyl-ACP biosynthesis
LTATFQATTKNKPFADFYSACGFRRGEIGAQDWIVDLDNAELSIPDYIIVTDQRAPERTDV